MEGNRSEEVIYAPAGEDNVLAMGLNNNNHNHNNYHTEGRKLCDYHVVD